eukprot:scaffold85695_cov69-Phaeocystis_antarctica.AAC.1
MSSRRCPGWGTSLRGRPASSHARVSRIGRASGRSACGRDTTPGSHARAGLGPRTVSPSAPKFRNKTPAALSRE